MTTRNKEPRPITYVLRFADGDRIELGRTQARRMLRRALAKSGGGYIFAAERGARTVHLNAGRNQLPALYLDVFVGRPQTPCTAPNTERATIRRDLIASL